MTDDATDGTGRSDAGTAERRHSAYYEQIRSLAADAREERRTFEEPSDAETRALSYVREGVAPVTGVYVEGHTGGERVRFSESELDLLHRALNDWLSLYARCYGVDVDPDATIRTAAEILLQTHDARSVAQLLTDAPPRR